MVRQLYHLGVIEAFEGTLKKNKGAEQMKPYEVAIDPELNSRITEVIGGLDIKPVHVVRILKFFFNLFILVIIVGLKHLFCYMCI